jgi:hypothetical protein
VPAPTTEETYTCLFQMLSIAPPSSPDVWRFEPLPYGPMKGPPEEVAGGVAQQTDLLVVVHPTDCDSSLGDDVIMDKSPSQLIDARIEELGDWRGELLARLRGLVKEADPEVVEEWKWRGVPTWYHDGMICTGETYKSVVKMTFAKGASLEDPSGLFNSSLEGNTRRAIDFHEDDEIDEKALKALIRAAVALNTG